MKPSFERVIFIIALLWYSLTAYFSSGYHQADEHYQIIEFAELLRGNNAPDDLPWEYRDQIRSTIHPVICYQVFAVCDFLSITNPYSRVFVLRLLTAFLSVTVIYFFIHSVRQMVSENYWKAFVILSYFVWFLPFINVRFSSESWSGILLLLAVGFIIRDNKNLRYYLVIGSLLGLSFLFRFQIAFAVIGILARQLFIKKESYYHLFLIIVSGLFILSLGVLLDTWFYGNFVFTPWNYFKANILEGVASQFGTAPWYTYFNYILLYAVLPIGLMIICSTVFLTYTDFKNINCWIVIPFVLFHSIVGHKEPRFLFPIANFVPLILVLSVQNINWPGWISVLGKMFFAGASFIFIINFACMIISCITPAGVGRTRIMERLNSFDGNITLCYLNNISNPYSPWGNPGNYYYSKNNIERKKLNSIEELKASVSSGHSFYIFCFEELRNPEIRNAIHQLHLNKQCQSIPEFAVPFLNFWGFETDYLLVLYSTDKLNE